jgi:molybdopterin molybdotransferase
VKTVEEVFHLLDSLTPKPLPQEVVPLASALGRILLKPIQAPEDQPPFDRSSIDGYLLRHDAKPGVFKISSTHRPGEPAPNLPEAGCAIRIFTGSALPPDAALVMQEDTRTQANGSVEILKSPCTALIRPRASQCKKGDPVIAAGTALQSGTIGLLASLGISKVPVSSPARVAHLVTGGELVESDQTPQIGQIRDSNSPLIASLLSSFPAQLVWQKRVGDGKEQFLAALRNALAAQPHLLLVSGASSVGDQDHTASALEELGFKIHARQVSVKPGKPLIIAQNKSTLAFGLPGNPLSHFVCYHLFVRRVLRRWAGRSPAEPLEAELLDAQVVRSDPRETWWPGRLEPQGGRIRARALAWSDSSDLTCLATADCLICIPAGQQARSPVKVLPTISP